MRSLLLGGLVCLVFALPVRAGEFWEPFDGSSSCDDTGRMYESSNHDWWLTSGGRFYERSGIASTIEGSLASDDPVRVGYARANPRDTDQGYHPQNIFRVIARREWRNFSQSLRFRIRGLHQSDSPNRNESNGVLLMSRYLDSDNVYYAGLRVDGYAVIKKKLGGAYTTLGKVRLYGTTTYDRESRPFFLPGDRWLRIGSRITNTASGNVIIRLLFDDGGGAGWREVLEAVDSPGGADGPPITSAGYTGIRSDFMDVEFTSYWASDD